jgi:hypothetical protein
MSLSLLSIVDNIGSGKTIESSSIDIKVCVNIKISRTSLTSPEFRFKGMSLAICLEFQKEN